MDKIILQDICNCYMYLCSNKEELKDYEEKLLDKCFDINYERCTMYCTQYEAPTPPFSMT